MRKNSLLKLTALLAIATLFTTGCSTKQNRTESENEPRGLYTYSFGGLEDMEVENAVELLDRLGYAGIAAEARGEASLDRLDQYYEWSEGKGDHFEIAAAYLAHRFDKFGFSDAAHKAAIDRLEGKGGTIWVWVRDAKQDGSITDEKVENFIMGIVEYAHSKGVKVVLYPHYNTYFPTTLDTLKFVEKVNHPALSTAINLCHELMSYKGDVLAQTFEKAKGRIGAIIISGALVELDETDVGTMNASTILSLDKSIYDLRPFMRLIKTSGFDGPIGFINFRLPDPEDYLKRTITRWNELCEEVGLYE